MVTIGLPVYNGEHFIARAIESLLAQDYANFNLVVSDNCSTDRTSGIVEGFARRDARVRLTRTSRNMGGAANFRRVLKLAQGDYFMWAACDDLWRPPFVSSLVRELEAHPDAQVAMTGLDRVTEDGRLYDTIRFGANGLACPNDKTRFQLFKMIQYGAPIYFYFYGLYRTAFLKRVMRCPVPEVPGKDILFMSQIALATKFRYVDGVHHVRTVRNGHFTVRHPEDLAARLELSGRWTPLRHLQALIRHIHMSEVIPWKLKAQALLWLGLNWIDSEVCPTSLNPYRLFRRLLRRRRGNRSSAAMAG
jgi:glycosyltransferase involved in cell wall biosynthesis